MVDIFPDLVRHPGFTYAVIVGVIIFVSFWAWLKWRLDDLEEEI
jgi:hypothetical protein